MVEENLIKVLVADNRIGINSKQQLGLFEFYARCDRYILGLAMELYLSRQIVNAYGGEIGFNNCPSKGTTF